MEIETQLEISLSDVCSHGAGRGHEGSIEAADFTRSLERQNTGVEILLDSFPDTGAACAFLRIPGHSASHAKFSITGGYEFVTVPAGGWLLRPANESTDEATYWIPRPPLLRTLDESGHLLSIQPAELTGTSVSSSALSAEIRIPEDHNLDMVIWKLPAEQKGLRKELELPLLTLESQPCFLWSSHTTYRKPSDLYLHLIHGHVYENHEVWPRYWRVCSELDAYALYVTLSGLEKATGKQLYSLLRREVAYSVISRQAADGGWYHGEWTDTMESHYRLDTAAVLLLTAFYEETGERIVLESLQKAAAFSAGNTERLEPGIWFYHDSMEQSPDMEKLYPFKTAKSQVLGKSVNNLLVLNTHLDTTIALERYRQVTGDQQYAELVDSARRTAHAVLELRPAEQLYRLLYGIIYLSFLPTSKAAALPVHLRALKRLGWKYLIPKLNRIKARFPRIVMPGGFIERDLVQGGGSVRYQPVNLMDLARWENIFEDPFPATKPGVVFTAKSGIKDRWKENSGKEDDALGFWAEALYHLCLTHTEREYRAWLAEAVIDLEDNGLGLSPSLLGANAEAVPLNLQQPCPSPVDGRIRVVNLYRGKHLELLVINTAAEAITLEWETAPPEGISWHGEDASNTAIDENSGISIPPRSWLWGQHERSNKSTATPGRSPNG